MARSSMPLWKPREAKTLCDRVRWISYLLT